MTPDAGSLDRLHDILAPPAAPWWPPAPGWLWLLAFLGIAALALLLALFIRFQRNRYRREALDALARLDLDAGTRRLTGVAEVLKRTALTAYPRTEVAALTGAQWYAFLDRVGGTGFSQGLGERLDACVHTGRAADAELYAQSLAEIRRWIRAHRPAPVEVPR